jgi:hypothetical protein
MTRTTFKALWVGGGGILATWLAVSPKDGVPAASQQTAVQRPASSSEPIELNEQTARLRARSAQAKLGSSTRNPFRFSVPKSVPPTFREHAPLPAAAAPIASAAPPPAMQLSGVAQTNGKRTAVISGDGQMYLVAEGDSVAGRYTVVKVDPEAVLLRDSSGVEQRLTLPQ